MLFEVDGVPMILNLLFNDYTFKDLFDTQNNNIL